MKGTWIRAALLACGLLGANCAGDGTASGGVYDPFFYDDPWYVGGSCCVDYPVDIGPPHPEHPIVIPPGQDLKPTHPIALPPSSRPMPSPRPAAMPRGGGGRR
jgi:hypothetical protein